MYGIIYRYTSPSGKSYIGQTITPNRRKTKHKCLSKRGIITKFYNAVRKYGFENFKYEVLVTICLEDKFELRQILNWLERYFIWKYKSFGENGYNMTEGGDGFIGYPAWNKGLNITEETRQRISSSMKGKYLGEQNPFYGKHHSEQTKQKMSEARKGRTSWNKGKHRAFDNPEHTKWHYEK